MDEMEDLELTPGLLQFYRAKIHELQREQSASVLDRLKQVELTAQQRTRLERELFEYEDELDQSHQDIEDIRNVCSSRCTHERHWCASVEQ